MSRIRRLWWRQPLAKERQGAKAKVGQIQDLSEADSRIIQSIRPYTLTSVLRIEALLQSVRFCVERKITGSFVECGVWKGGSVMAMILQLQAMGIEDRDIYLYDTFDGMTEPSEMDTSPFEAPALETWWDSSSRNETAWARFFSEDVFNEEGVRALLESTGYPVERLHFVRGKVEDTLPAIVPEKIALLRLDTDWYESTRHELIHLYPRISTGGVLIIDDYGHWDGARKAVDEYFAEIEEPMLLNRIDYTGRLAIKI